MTPKEKAQELAIKFCSKTDVFKPNIASIRFALIAVDEIIKSNTNVTGSIINGDYWQEVKTEIEKL